MSRYDPAKHHRRSVRLSNYDYWCVGAYFVTVCVQNRACVLGEVVNDEVRPSESGRIVVDTWESVSERFPTVRLDAFVVMPNHVHAITMIEGARSGGGGDEGVMNHAPTEGTPNRDSAAKDSVDVDDNGDQIDRGDNHGKGGATVSATESSTNVGAQFIAPASPRPPDDTPTLGEIVRALKAVSTRRIRLSGNDQFAWQRNYYEHVIRSDQSLNRVRQYIVDNPRRWAMDSENPHAPAKSSSRVSDQG